MAATATLTRCKFRVTGIRDVKGGAKEVTFTAMHDPTLAEGQRFNSQAPTGTLIATIDNAAILSGLRDGVEYWVDLHPVT